MVNIVTCVPQLSKSSVNKSQHRQTVFYGVSPTTVAMQGFGKHASTTETVFSAGSVPRNLKGNRPYRGVEGSILEC
jgi:hypothetical protein